MLSAQIFSALTVSLCLLIDNIVIGSFLGEKAIASYVLANPLLLSIGAIGMLLSAGVQVVCGKSLGKGLQEETHAGYSSAIVIGGGISLVFLAAVLLFHPFLTRAMGAGSEGELYGMTKDYLIGYSIGAPGSMGALVLVPFLQMAGQSNLLIVGVLSMTVADVALDLLNVTVFHGGMFGMGLASSLSYYVAMIIVGFYFLSGRCVFRFSWKRVSLQKMAELFRSGFPSCFGMAASVILVFAINHILKPIGGEKALAAFAAISTLGNTANAVTTGTAGVSLTLSGIFFHEEDRTALQQLIRLLCRYAVVLSLAVAVILLVFAPALISLFIPRADEAQRMAILGLRLFAAGIFPCCVCNALRGAYQGTGRILLTEILALLEGAVFPTAVAFLFTRLIGVNGAWLYFPVGEWLTLVCVGVLIRVKTKKMPWKEGTALLLKDGFGVVPEDLLELDIHSMQEVTDAAEQAEKFCIARGVGVKEANHIALCIEERAANTIQHGFATDRKHHDLSVRLLKKDASFILRFRDNCSAFDPVHYVPEKKEAALGLRLMLAFAEEAHYTYAMNLNNLCIRIAFNPREQATPEA